MLKKIVRRSVVTVLALAALWFGAALVMVFLPAPKFTHTWAAEGANSLQGAGTETAKRISLGLQGEAEKFRMRDGAILQARRFASEVPVTVLFIHGVMSSSTEYLETCRRIRDLTGAEVFALDLRGHGKSEGVPGDIRYIGQYEDDVADVMAALRMRKPSGRIILAGHSMGGGIAMRYVATHEAPAADGYLLFSPHLGVKSPTMRTEPAPGQTGSEPAMKVDLPRTIGLVMLNAAGVRWLNGLPTLFFNAPPQDPMHTYSFRAMASVAPDDHLVALTADSKPLLVIVGTNDEAFHAERFASVVSKHKHGETVVIEGETHDSIVRSSAALRAAADWMSSPRTFAQYIAQANESPTSQVKRQASSMQVEVGIFHGVH